MEEFIREQIKEKPLNKKKIFLRLGVSALCGLVFALVACLVFALAAPFFFKDKTGVTDNDSETEFVPVISSETEPEPETETKDTQKTIVKELTISDYQRLQNELYAVGNKVNSSIVSITRVASDKDWFNNSYETVGTGAGLIISESDKEILILTEHRVVEDAKSISVTFINDESAEAKLKKYDGNTGIAILSVSKEGLPSSVSNTIKVAELTSSCTVTKGMITIALGSPLGTNYSVLTGTITSTDNEISTWDNNYSVFNSDIIGSKDASGILVNVQGKVVGLVMQGFSGAGSGNTLTAVAISEVEPLLKLLMNNKDVPYFGLQVVTVTSNIADTYNLPSGVYIKDVKLDSPAMIAGIQVGDIITEINDVPITTVSEYSAQILGLSPGESYKVKYKRETKNGYTERTCMVEAGVLQ